jgi:hypothetical protein
MNLRLRADVTLCDTEDAAVLLDEQTGRYWQLNHTGALILHALLDGNTPQQIAATLTNRFHVTPQHATTDVETLLAQLTHAALVTS